MTDTAWDQTILDEIAQAEEIIVAVSRDGADTDRVPIWVVVVDGDVYVRSYKGVTSRWFRRAEADPDQVLVLGGRELDIEFVDVDRLDHINKAIDAAYDSKYSKYDYVSAMSEPAAVEATLRVLPR
jgi:hypothetical protein